jgi:hypothetical protein
VTVVDGIRVDRNQIFRNSGVGGRHQFSWSAAGPSSPAIQTAQLPLPHAVIIPFLTRRHDQEPVAGLTHPCK